MSVTVELVSIGVDQYSQAEPVGRLLSDSQPDLQFRVPPAKRRGELARLAYREYAATSTLDELRTFGAKGVQVDTSYLGLVAAPLEGNIFAAGDTKGKPFTAVVTTHNFARYTRRLDAFLGFYFVRWALKFAAPQLVPHKPGVADNCVFGPRKDKRDLVAALEHPHLCDECIRLLQPAFVGGLAIASIDACLGLIADLNAQAKVSTVIMKGGGVKGAALAGAVTELSDASYVRFFAPTTFVGTSAGAITAAFLAAGLTPKQLLTELKTDFAKLLEPKSGIPRSLWRGAGLYAGDVIEDWIEKTLRNGSLKLTGAPRDPVRLEDIKAAGKRLVVYAANRYGTLTFDSDADPQRPVARAVRFSMSIPFFFTIRDHDGDEVFDGGLLNNYPVEVFRRQNPDARGEFVAIYLSDGEGPTKPSRFMILRLLSILLDRDEFTDVKKFSPSTIKINCAPVKTVDFGLSDTAKRLLENRGRLAALKYIHENGWADRTALESRMKSLASEVASDEVTLENEMAIKRQRRTRILQGVGIALAIGALLGAWFLG